MSQSQSGFLWQNGDKVPQGLVSRAYRGLTRAVRATAFTLAALLGSAIGAEAEDRTLKLYFPHTGEKATVTYKRDGRFDHKAMAQLNHFLRDWRRNRSIRMDPQLIDLVWQIYRRSGSDNYIHVVSGYRSPETNGMLRGRSRATGVAKKSQHMLGKAMDFFIPGVKLSSLRAIALQEQGGGVGYYPTSGSPFVHVDVGNVRAWPRLSRQELARLFPDGRTLHIPADGRPMAGYALARADDRRRGTGIRSPGLEETEADDDRPSWRTALPPSVPVRTTIAAAPAAPLPNAPSRPSALTAMVPVSTNRQSPKTGSPPVSDAAASSPAFTDLAALAIPAPAIRPSATPARDMLQTASIAPLPRPAEKPGTAPVGRAVGPADLAGGLLSGLSSPLSPPPAPASPFKAPQSGSIASLPITGPDIDPEDDFDAQENLISWAIAAPGAPAGMTAPVVVGRTLTDLTAEPAHREPLPAAISEEFDHDRFWSRG